MANTFYTLQQAINKSLVVLVKSYQILFSRGWKPCCRFYPSCSEYAIQALKEYSTFRALGLIGWRLLRCHPYLKGGEDLLPPKKGNIHG